MSLPVTPPLAPMLAKLVRELPVADGLFYEPKWDGFRCIVFRDGADVVLGSRNEKPLDRYFPELIESLLANVPDRCVLDGEIVIAGPSGLDFDALSQRIHPAASRVLHLSRTTPASFVAFDLLAIGDHDLREEPFATRRAQLQEALAGAHAPVHVTPTTTSPEVARDWFSRFEGAGLDGVVAKADDLHYQPNKRVMMKVKHERTADCVVGGFRTHKDGGVGSLLLGLFDNAGLLHHVGLPPGSVSPGGPSWWTCSRRTARRQETAIHGVPKVGPVSVSREGRVDGARERTFHGSRCAPSWWPR